MPKAFMEYTLPGERLRVGINAHLMSFGKSYRGAGISRYIRNLLLSLPEALAAEGAKGVAFLGKGEVPQGFFRSPLHFTTSALPTERPSLRILWEQLVAPLQIQARGVDVFHSTAYVLPVLPVRAHSVVTVHDLSFIRMPEVLPRGNRVYLAQMTKISLRRASKIIAVSESTKAELIDLLGIVPEKIAVVHHGVEPEFRRLPESEVKAFLARQGLADGYILSVGTIEPRKDLPTLIRAYAKAREQGLRLPLVLIGGKGWGYEEVFSLVETLGLKSEIIFPGFVTIDELPLWYNGASLFAYPSRYEGFGMPVLEAMACGAPVITTDSSSLPEVAGEAGVLFQPGDFEMLAGILVELGQNAERRNELSSLGLNRTMRFSREGFARRTFEVYHQAYGR